MFVQWCIKGIHAKDANGFGLDDGGARAIIDQKYGIICRWWQNQKRITLPEVRQKLTRQNLERHVHQYAAVDPSTGASFCDGTPFISLAAGCIERDTFLQTNIHHPAHLTALDFATKGGTVDGYLFYCWVIVGLRPAVSVDAVSEEIRELNTYRRYSAYQTEGEVTAKIAIPANQIQRYEKYAVGAPNDIRCVGVYYNPGFDPPLVVSNIREFF